MSDLRRLLHAVRGEVRFATRVLLSGVVCAVLFAMVTLVRRPTFESFATVAGVSSDGLSSRLSGLALQFGLSDLSALSEGGTKATADLIIQVSRLESVIDSVLVTRVPDPSGGTWQERLLVDQVGHDGQRWGSTRARFKARQLYAQNLVLARNAQTNTASLRLTTHSARLSRDLLTEHIRRVDAVFRELGRASALDEVSFATNRIRDRNAQVEVAERRLAAFLRSNRAYQQSPDGVFEYERLRRELTLHESVLNQLTQSAEEASLRLVRETRSVAVISAPNLPIRPQSRQIFFQAFVGFFVGMTLWVLGYQIAAMVARRLASDADVS